MVEKSMNI